jgi:hypothetical protein
VVESLRTRQLLALGAVASCTACAAAAALPGSGIGTRHAGGENGALVRRTPTAPAPKRVSTMALYQGNGENKNIPASFMAANYDWTEQAATGEGATFANAFKTAGGAHAVLYAAPNARICSGPGWKPGTCTDVLSPEIDALTGGAWLHRQGHPNTRAYADGHQRNNPLNAQFRTAWIHSIDVLLSPSTGSPAWAPAAGGAVELDNMNWVNLRTYTGVWGPFTEITSDQQVLEAQRSAIGYTPGAVLLNGVNYDYPLGGAYDLLMSAVGSNVVGVVNQNAFATSYAPNPPHDGYMTSTAPIAGAWQNQQNGILDVLARGKYDFVWMAGGADARHRLYGLGSFWLSYDPQRSVLWEDFCTPDGGGDCDSTWADGSVVPTQPLQSATNDVEALHAGGVYRREFALCYQAGAPIGPCAAIVNPSGTSAVLPPLGQNYTKAIVLDSRSAFAGGGVSWTPFVPGKAASKSAMILSNAP